MAREKMMMVKKKRMMTMRNRRNFIFCKCAVTENIRKTTKKYTSKNLIILYKKIDYNINFKDENKKKGVIMFCIIRTKSRQKQKIYIIEVLN